jgi:hypothetical protein
VIVALSPTAGDHIGSGIIFGAGDSLAFATSGGFGDLGTVGSGCHPRTPVSKTRTIIAPPPPPALELLTLAAFASRTITVQEEIHEIHVFLSD